MSHDVRKTDTHSSTQNYSTNTRFLSQGHAQHTIWSEPHYEGLSNFHYPVLTEGLGWLTTFSARFFTPTRSTINHSNKKCNSIEQT